MAPKDRDALLTFYDFPAEHWDHLRTSERVEVITSVQRRRRWSTEEKVRIVEETYLPGNSVSLVARRHGIAGLRAVTSLARHLCNAGSSRCGLV